MSALPTNIMKMIRILHSNGYSNLYLYSGLSPSGLNWRFNIGRIKNGEWPSEDVIVNGSVRVEGEVEWSKDTSSLEVMSDNFIAYYNLVKPSTPSVFSSYTKWFEGVIKMLGEEPLIYYADYEAPHRYLLELAEGYRGRIKR